jgi:hypothetical protein
MYDASKLKTPKECRTVMERAKNRNLPEVYNAAFRRFCELVATAHDDPSDPLVCEFYKTLAAYEQLLTEKNGRNTPASRTRQKITKKGIQQSLIEWTCAREATDGFKLLIAKGLPEYTGEYLVAKHHNRFPKDVVATAKSRLAAHEIALPKIG